MFASGPASRPLSMWMEMSQYMPMAATISETVATEIGRDAHPGTPVARSAASAARASAVPLPERWRITARARSPKAPLIRAVARTT